jgi:hypothetical protein
MPKKTLVLAVVVFSMLAGAAPRPASVVGTWTGVGNLTAVQVVITAQGTTGTCKAITGTMNNLPFGGASNIQGFYCPSTGRIGFVRKDPTTNVTFQTYSGNLSNTATTLRMAGVFAELAQVGQLGEYNFSLTK